MNFEEKLFTGLYLFRTYFLEMGAGGGGGGYFHPRQNRKLVYQLEPRL